jgi:hypothetical protein
MLTLYVDMQFVTRSKHASTRLNRLVNAECSDVHTQHINVHCVQNVDFLYVKSPGA